MRSSLIFSAVIKGILQLMNSPFRLSGEVFCSHTLEHFNFVKSFTTFTDDNSTFFADSLTGANFMNQEEHRTAILIDFDCPSAMEILANASQAIYFNYKWILFHSNPKDKFEWKVMSGKRLFFLHFKVFSKTYV